MKILKKGEAPTKTHKFTCENCGTIFLAEETEFTKSTSYEGGEKVIKYEYSDDCPICVLPVVEFKTE